jgi:regulator of cell morphogenesis and NO signaling
MTLDRNATVAQIVAAHAVAARVFQKNRIDYCCRGNVTVPEACRPIGLDPEALFAELEAIVPANDRSGDADPRTLSTADLIARIVDRHHAYLRRTLPYLDPLVAKVARVHGDRNSRLALVHEAFSELSAALDPHLDQEEQVLFPALLAPTPDRGIVERELAAMHQDHLGVGELLFRIRELTDGFVTPEWGCNTYRVVMVELEALEGDIFQHVHLETHVLMPRFVRVAEAA